VAPFVGCAGVEQKGREAWVTPDQWSIYDTTDSYAVANPVRVEHLIVMVPKERCWPSAAWALDALMARRLGGSGGVSRLALETMRSAYRELPSMSEAAAAAWATPSCSSCTCRCWTWPASAPRRPSARRCASASSSMWREHLADPRLTVDAIARR
jgi:hypothetical protein